jgi:hypothetical protein
MWWMILACVSEEFVNSDKVHPNPMDTGDSVVQDTVDSGDISCSDFVGADQDGLLSQSFQEWLLAHPEFSQDLVRSDLVGGSFGGLIDDADCVQKQPVIFIHGNSDRASGGSLGGWTDLRNYFLANGYRNAELYATTYGPASFTEASNYRHDRDNVLQVRQFIEAVLAYTGTEKVDIVAFSLGVTMARKAILGGGVDYDDFDLGPALTDKVDTFVGIAGANLGLTSCYFAVTPSCSNVDGLYPGYVVGLSVMGQANILENINTSAGYEGDYRYSIWSPEDDVIGYECVVWGENTNTASVILGMVTEHTVP